MPVHFVYVLDVGVFLYFYWWFLDFASTRELFGMAGSPWGSMLRAHVYPDQRSALVREQAQIVAKEERKIMRDIVRSKRRVDQYSEMAAELATER